MLVCDDKKFSDLNWILFLKIVNLIYNYYERDQRVFFDDIRYNFVCKMKVKPIRYKVSFNSYLHFIDSQNCVVNVTRLIWIWMYELVLVLRYTEKIIPTALSLDSSNSISRFSCFSFNISFDINMPVLP